MKIIILLFCVAIALTWCATKQTTDTDTSTGDTTASTGALTMSWINKSKTTSDKILVSGTIVFQENEFCKDPSLGWDCSMKDVWFQFDDSRFADGSYKQIQIGCYSGSIDKVIAQWFNEKSGAYRWWQLNSPLTWINDWKRVSVTMSNDTTRRKRSVDAPDQRPWVCMTDVDYFAVIH